MQKSKFKFGIFLFGLFFSVSAIAQEKIPTQDEFFEIIQTQGVGKAVKLFHHVRKRNPDVIIFEKSALNSLGYQFLAAEKVEEAIEIFNLNVIAYPDWTTYDSKA